VCRGRGASVRIRWLSRSRPVGTDGSQDTPGTDAASPISTTTTLPIATVPVTIVPTTLFETETTVAPTTVPDASIPDTTVPGPVIGLPSRPTGLIDIGPTGSYESTSEIPPGDGAFGSENPIYHAFDDDVTTSWISAGDADTKCAEELGRPCAAIAWSVAQSEPERLISAIRIVGNQQNADPSLRAGCGFGSVDVAVFSDVVGHFITLTCFGHDSPNSGGVASVEVLVTP